VGRWRDRERGFLVQIERRGDRFVMLGITHFRGVVDPPEVVAEFRPSRQGKREFVGRHLWGGKWGTQTDGPSWWGKDGSLKIQLVTRDSIHVEYTDSRYTGGWTYLRESPGPLPP
jgi:hypothetical protein